MLLRSEAGSDLRAVSRPAWNGCVPPAIAKQPYSHAVDPARTLLDRDEISLRLGSAAQFDLEVLEHLRPLSEPPLGISRRTTLSSFYERMARALFGDEVQQPVSYVALRRAFSAHGGREAADGRFKTFVDRLPADARESLFAGRATPDQLFSATASSYASFFASPHRASFTELISALKMCGRYADFERALRWFQPEERRALVAGRLSPEEALTLIERRSRHEVDVVVVGAGAAGLAAARELLTAGKRVVVLEARARIGGRAHTDHATFDVPFDVGAAWIHSASENPLRPIAERLGFTLVPDDRPMQAYDGEHDPRAAGQALAEEIHRLEESAAELARRAGDVPMSLALPAVPRKWTPGAAQVLGPLELGVEIDRVSTMDYARLMPERGDCFVREGLGSLVSALGHGVPVVLDAPVSAIIWGREGVSVIAGGETYRGKKVLVTTSCGVQAEGTVEFSPSLPRWKQAAVERMQMALYNKIALEFDGGTFEDVEPGTRMRLFDGEKGAIDFVVRPFGSNMVIGFVGGEFARSLERAGEQAAIELALSAIERIYGQEARSACTKASVTCWGRDSWALGSYSAAAPGFARERRTLGRPIENTVFFAGEACHEVWGQQVAGAFLTGRSAARDIRRQLDHERASSAPCSHHARRPDWRIAVDPPNDGRSRARFGEELVSPASDERPDHGPGGGGGRPWSRTRTGVLADLST